MYSCNLIKKTIYNDEGRVKDVENFTYTDKPNVFKQLCILNVGNFLGIGEAAMIEMQYNKNQLATSPFSTFTYSLDSKNLLTKQVIKTIYGVYTYNFFY